MENFIEREEDREEDFTPGCCFSPIVNTLPNHEVSPCLIFGCRDLELRCIQCGRLVCSYEFNEGKYLKKEQ